MDSLTPHVDRLVARLSELGIKPKKTRAEMEKQLKNAAKRENARQDSAREKSDRLPEYYLVFDVEGTCDKDTRFDYESEIIEFPVVLIEAAKLEVVAEFHRYVRPILNPILSAFCTSLTGITQEMVEQAEPFHVVYSAFNEWLAQYAAPPFRSCLFCTDGPWDLRDFIEKEFVYHGYDRPEFMWSVLDVRKAFTAALGTPSGNLSAMLTTLGLVFEGKQHSGIDDARNIARIVLHLARSGFRLEANTNLRKHKIKRGHWAKLRKDPS
ncbi:3'-5' exoribonuclease 1 [Kappamyces sp. JEL0829]|nr:3'-5' exoribonuclease 1 [Kappamyces sp. JEL0829]